MADVSSNDSFDESLDEIENESVIESEDESENESENESEDESIDESEDESQNEVSDDYEENSTYTVLGNDSYDYSQYFENLQTIGILIAAEILALGIAFAFFKGLRK